jgi:uncharacterized protein YecT (DUF1311 family)
MIPMRRFFLPLVLLIATPSVPQQPTAADDQARFKAMDKTMESAPPQQRLAWNALLVAFTTFRDAHLRESHQSERSKLDADFLLLAEGHPPAGFPSFTADDLATADATLNESYERVLANLPPDCSGHASGCLSQATFRDIQRDWIRYRDAWLTFATLRWPQVTSEAWLTLLTTQRTTQINGLARSAP